MLRGWRRLRIGLHLARGVLTVALAYPLSGDATRLRLRQNWSRKLLSILGLELQAGGCDIAPGCMLVANHVSWIDIFVINALTPSAFISKHEVRTWPVIGWLAAKSETVFLRRGSRGHAKIVNAEIASLLGSGRNVAVFPEGTTTDGSHVLHFHAALLQPAIEAGRALQTLALSYHHEDGSPSRAPAYDGDLSLSECLNNILAHRRLVARIAVDMPLATSPESSRRELARQTRELIAARIGADTRQSQDATMHAPATSMQPETA
ncbi:MAG: 1-acyl-sn-glycerol-3-phosphate acyltransferase [Azoarcus sp.]|nr:1-acyl-sn-glycerol-3-phosphate acyltransferase [Azoarcus sp.]